MREFKTDDLERGPEAVCDAASDEPVAVTDAAGRRFVLTTADDYARLIKRPGDPRRVFGVGETPTELTEFLVGGLKAKSAELGAADDG